MARWSRSLLTALLLSIGGACHSRAADDEAAPASSAASDWAIPSDASLEWPSHPSRARTAQGDAAAPLVRKLSRSSRAWRFAFPRPQGEALHAIGLAPDGVLLAVGDDGTVVRSADHAASFTVRKIDDHDLLSLFIDARGTAYAVAHSGLVVRSRDSGITWEALATGNLAGLRAIWGTPEGNLVVAVGSHGTIARSTDRGVTWLDANSGGEDSLEAVWGRSASEIYAAGAAGKILQSRDGGVTWSSLTPDAGAPAQRMRVDLRALWGTPEGEVFAAGVGGAILHKLPAARVFSPETIGFRSRARLSALWGEGGDVYAGGDSGLFMMLATSRDGTRGWTAREGDLGVDIRALAGAKKDIYAATRRGTLLRSTDGGATWSRSEPIAATFSGRALYCESEKSIFVAGTEGTVLHSSDGGTTWALQKTGTEQELRGIGGAGREVYAVGAAGEIRRSTNGGTTWTAVPSGITTDLNAVWSTPAGDVIVVGDEGVALFSAKGTGKFTSSVAAQSALRAIWARSANDIFVVGDEGVVLHSVNGRDWTPAKSGTTKDLYAIAGASTGPIYAVGAGVLLRSATGVGWEIVSEPKLSLTGVSVGPLGEVDAVGASSALFSRDGGATFRTERVTRDDLHALSRTSTGRLFALAESAVLYLDEAPPAEPRDR